MKTMLLKRIDGFDKYYISKEGDVMNTDYHGTGKSKMLKPTYDKNGYKCVGLRGNDGKHHFKGIHRLVAETFIPNPDNLPQVNHKDENILNNHVDNLEWCSAKYNCNYGGRNSRISSKNSKKVYAYNEDGELVKAFKSTWHARRSGFWYIFDCLKGRRDTYKGLRWSYEKL